MSETVVLYKKLLADFLKFKSVSTDIKYLKDIENTSKWLEKLFKKSQFKTALWKTKSANPVVFASYSPSTIHNTLSTVLIYGHYDVQPANKANGWKSEPFLFFEDSKRLYGRGVIDNKGQVLVHIATILQLIKIKKLGVNVKFIIEGNEETGNTQLSKVMAKHKKELKCDYVLVSDGELTNNKPSIETSLRGGFNCTLIYKTGKTNLHSGIWGGAVPNAAYELTKFLSKLYDKNNTVSFRGFYAGLDKVTKEELANNKQLEKETKSLTKLAGVNQLLKEKGYDFYTGTGLRPTIQVSGLKSGYIDTGYSNIVPGTAEVRLNIRIAPSQKSAVIMKALQKFVKEHTPKYVDFKLKFNHPHEPVKISTNSKYLNRIENILTKVYKSKVNRRNVGGAIPFVGDVKSILGVDTVLVPLANEDCNMHGANENFDKKFLLKALEFSNKLFSL